MQTDGTHGTYHLYMKATLLSVWRSDSSSNCCNRNASENLYYFKKYHFFYSVEIHSRNIM